VSERASQSVVQRLARAWQIVRGRDEGRAIIGTTYPNFPGVAGGGSLSLVRTANPQEFKPEGATVRAEGFSRHPVVHACIRVVADIVASVPLVVLRERGNSESKVGEDHPLQRLLDYPGPRFTARQFRAKFAVDFLGYGNSFTQIERQGGQGRPVGLRAINAESIQSVWVDAEGDPRRYDYGNWSGIIVQVPVEDILHFRDLDMSRPFQPECFGFPRGATAIASIAADNEATKYVRQVVTNDGTPTFAVLLADEATQDDAQAMQSRYVARTVDRGKRGTPAFFGAVRDIKPLGFTLSDLEFPDLRRVSREDICAAFGVDPRMIGIASATSDAGLSGAQYAEARARLVQHTIEPMFSAFEDELNHWLAPEFGDVWITYDHDMLRDLVENDAETSERVRAEFKDSLRTWEEARRALKLPPVPIPTDTLAMTTGTQLVPAAVAVIDPTAVMDEPPATDNETPAVGPGPQETEADAETIDVEENEDGLADEQGRAASDVTNFPARGDNKTVSLRNSGFKVFPVAEAEALKANYPSVWRKGGNIRGNKQFTLLRPVAKRGGKVDGLSEENAVRRREAWAARHRKDFQLAGVVAQVKWLVVGDRGLDHMRAVLADAKAKADNRKRSLGSHVRTFAEDALSGDQIEALMELLEAVVEGELPIATVEGIILAAFPKLDADAVSAMLDGLEGFAPEDEDEPEEPEAPEMPKDEEPENGEAPEPMGEMAAMDEQRPWWVHVPPEDRPWWVEMAEAGTLQDEPRFQYWQRAMDELDREEGEYYTTARGQFAADAQSIALLFAQYAKEAATATDARKAQLLQTIDRLIRTNYQKNGEYYRAWKAAFEALIGQTYMVGARQVAGLNLSFTLQSPEVLMAIDERTAQLAEWIGEDTAKQVTAAIRAAEKAGFSVEETARLVQSSVYGENLTDVRATRIARTEAAHAMSRGSWDQAIELGIYQSKEWLSFEDSKTRTTHRQYGGSPVVPMDYRYGKMLYPLDPSGGPAETINCRCTLVFYTEPASEATP